MKISDLKSQMASEIKLAEETIAKSEKESRPMSVEERASVEARMAEASKLEKQISELQDNENLIASVRTKTANLNAVVERKVPASNPETSNEVSSVSFIRRDWSKEERGVATGHWFLAACKGSEHSRRWLSDKGIQVRNMFEGSTNDGGLFVPEQISSEIIINRNNYGIARQNVRVVPMSTDHQKWPTWITGTTASFVAEQGTVSTSTPNYNMVSLTAEKLGGISIFSRELAEDAALDIGNLVISEWGYALAKKEDDTVFIGDASSTYGGFEGFVHKFENNTSLAGVVSFASGHTAASSADNADITSVMAALPQYAEPNAKFYCSRAVKAKLFDRLKAVAGGNRVDTLGLKPDNEYLGYPIVVVNSMTNTEQANKCCFLFGDLTRAALFGSRNGLNIMPSAEYQYSIDCLAVRVLERMAWNIHQVGTTSVAGPVVCGTYHS